MAYVPPYIYIYTYRTSSILYTPDSVTPASLARQLKDTYNQFGFAANPETIFNMDETGMALCPRPPKVDARKGQKKVRYQTSGQKSQVTILACGSATGQIISHLLHSL